MMFIPIRRRERIGAVHDVTVAIQFKIANSLVVTQLLLQSNGSCNANTVFNNANKDYLQEMVDTHGTEESKDHVKDY